MTFSTGFLFLEWPVVVLSTLRSRKWNERAYFELRTCWFVTCRPARQTKVRPSASILSQFFEFFVETTSTPPTSSHLAFTGFYRVLPNFTEFEPLFKLLETYMIVISLSNWLSVEIDSLPHSFSNIHPSQVSTLADKQWNLEIIEIQPFLSQSTICRRM